ncbi:hypothetical protein CMEL01_15248 [Colletotrichum melonis]|uniref:Uncharacterized protein n=1 Tax=Colletotrichum melonis TaxID=1209925 RepID=A0AAI9XS24_9PEZI|nr:hypothetical protein CMEL01_15248 [Colletotrichum melonis]
MVTSCVLLRRGSLLNFFHQLCIHTMGEHPET